MNKKIYVVVVLGVIITTLSQTVSFISGDHQFYESVQDKCIKCHGDIKSQLSASTNHSSYACNSCHVKSATNHTNIKPECKYCHNVTQKLGDSLEAHTDFAPLNSQGCIACHTTYNAIVNYSRAEYIDYTITNKKESWIVSDVTTTGTLDLSYDALRQGGNHEMENVSCKDCHKDIFDAVSVGGHAVVLDKNGTEMPTHNSTNSTQETWCRTCHNRNDINFTTQQHSVRRTTCEGCHQAYNLTPHPGNFFTNMDTVPHLYRSLVCISCKSIGWPAPGGSVHFTVRQEPYFDVTYEIIDPLLIVNSSPASDPTTAEGESQTFEITLNKAADIYWYNNGSEIFRALSVISSSYTTSSASAGVYNITAVADDGYTSISRTWNWTVINQTGGGGDGGGGGSSGGGNIITGSATGSANSSNISGYVFDNYVLALPGVLVQNGSYQNITNASGYYSITNISNGNYTFSYSKEGFDTGYSIFALNGASVENVNVVIYDTTPPAQVSNLSTTGGSFYINNTWTNPADADFNYTWFNYSNGTMLQGVNKSTDYLNLTWSPHYTQNLSAQTVDTYGNINQTKVWFNATVPNNAPVQLQVGNKTIDEGQPMNFTVSATDADNDTITYSTSATKGSLNTTTGNFSWAPGYGDAGVYTWYFNSSDNYGGISTENIAVTVNNVPLSITSSSPVSDPATAKGEAQTFEMNLNRTADIIWYNNGSEIFRALSVTSSSYTNSSADAGIYNITAIANDSFDSVSMTWNWNVTAGNGSGGGDRGSGSGGSSPNNISGYVFDNYGSILPGVTVQNGSYQNTTSVDGYYSIINLPDGTYNFSYSRDGFNTAYFEFTLNGAVVVNANRTLYDNMSAASVSNPNMTTGNFYVNNTWVNPIDADFNYTWFRYSNDTTLQNISKPDNYLNLTWQPHYTQNISAQTVDISGNINQTKIWFNTTIPNNAPFQYSIGNKTVNENENLQFTVIATDADYDTITYGTNATKGSFNTTTGNFSWTPGYVDSGTYFWYFNSSDNYGGVATENITITVNDTLLSITSYSPLSDIETELGTMQNFSIDLNRTADVTWYMNGTLVQTNISVVSANFTNSTAGVGKWNITASATDNIDTASKTWNWTVISQPVYDVSGYVFDNYGFGLAGVQVQNGSKQNTTIASGYYIITGLFNGTYNFSYSKAGFDTGYLEITINGADVINANKTISDTAPPAQVTGLRNDTPTQTAVNLSWDPLAEAYYYQVFRNSSSLGYTQSTYWNDTGLTADTLYEYAVRANDSYNNWGQNSSILGVKTAPALDTIPPSSVSSPGTAAGNFYINNTWVNPQDNDFSHTWFKYSDGTALQNVSKPTNYLNLTWSPHYTQNISAQTVDTSGNVNQTKVWFNATIPDNAPVQSPIGDKPVDEGQWLNFTVSATDADGDNIIYGTNASRGFLNPTTGSFSWLTTYTDSGTYAWYFNSSDEYGGVATETITVTVNNVPLSVTSSSPPSDPTTTQGTEQSFSMSLNRTGSVTWYMNGIQVQNNASVTSAVYTNSTAGIGTWNVTASATDSIDTTSRMWNWTVAAQPAYNVSGYVFDNYGTGLGDVQVQNGSKLSNTVASGYYLITGFFNGTYNFSYTKAGFNTGYLEITINGADIINANKTMYDTTPPAQVTGLTNDTPTQATVNLTWNNVADANYYQVFRDSASLGYTQNNYWNDTGLTADTLYGYTVRANDSYTNWGQNSSILSVRTAQAADTTPPASVSASATATGNFYVNNTWVNPIDADYSHVWFRYSDGNTLQNVSKPTNYLNLTWSPHYTQNISAQTVDVSGNVNQEKVWFNVTIPNNAPVQSQVGNKAVDEGLWLNFTVSATDADSDTITYGTNTTKGTFDTSTGNFSWLTTYSEAGTYIWYFNSSDGLGGVATEVITITVNDVPLSITLFSPPSDPATTQGEAQSFSITMSRTASVTWYMNGVQVQTNASTTSATYTNSTAGAGTWNVTASATDGTDTASRTWNWTVNAPQPSAYIPPDPVNLQSTTGNFWVNHTWQPGSGSNATDSYNISVSGTWDNGTVNTFKNTTTTPHGWVNITVWAYNSSGTGSLSAGSISQSTQVQNNPPQQSPIGNKAMDEGQLLSFTVSATDVDNDVITYGTNATKGNLNTTSGLFYWIPSYGDAGVYTWYFNSSDGYGGVASEIVVVTVNNVPLSITSSSPSSDPATMQGTAQSFSMSLNRTADITWYMNGALVQTNASTTSAVYINSTAGAGTWNVTSSATDGIDAISKVWNWTVITQPTYNVSGYVFDNYNSTLEGVLVQNDSRQSTTSVSGHYSITGLLNGSYNFSFSKPGFNTGYLEVTINGADNTTADKTIYDTTPPASISNIAPAPAPQYINWTWTDPSGADFDHVEVYIDGAFKENVTGGVQYYNASYFAPNSTHTISTRTADLYDNVNTTWVNNTAATSSAYTYVSGFQNTTGTVTDFSNAMSALDGGASATLAEEEPVLQQKSVTKHATANPTMVLGSIAAGSYSNTLSSDNSYLNISETVGTGPPPDRYKLDSEWNSWEAVTEVSNSSLVGMNIGIEAYVDDGEAVYIQLWDFLNNNWNTTWHQLGASGLPTTDTNTVLWYNITNAAEIQRFVNATGNYRIRFADAKVAISFQDNSSSTFRVDEFMVIFNYNTTTYQLNITTNTTGIPEAANRQELQLRYYVSGDNFTLQVWNGSAWNNRTTLNDTTLSYRNITLVPEELIPQGASTGNAGSVNNYYVLVRYLDASPAQQGRLYLDYQRVYSE